MFLLRLLGRTSACGLLVPEGIIHPVVSVSVLTWFIRYPRFYYYHWVDTSAGGLLVPGGIIHPVVSVSVLTWFIRYFLSRFTVPK